MKVKRHALEATALGAAKMVLATGRHPAALRDDVPVATKAAQALGMK